MDLSGLERTFFGEIGLDGFLEIPGHQNPSRAVLIMFETIEDFLKSVL